MIVSIHQPNYLPYLGFFDKMRKSDIFVIYDDAQFNKDDFQHRNKIRIPEGWKWLTIPVEKKHKPINEIKIKNEVTWKGLKWSEYHFKNIRENYKDTPYYTSYEKDIKKVYDSVYKKLVNLNIDLINFLSQAFDINTEIVFSSDFGFKSKGTQRLVDLVDALGGDVYLSGSKGSDYLNLNLFKEKRIKVEFQEFKHPIYQQQFGGFVKNMAAVDALFNVGKLLGEAV